MTSIGFGAGTQVDHYRQERFSIAVSTPLFDKCRRPAKMVDALSQQTATRAPRLRRIRSPYHTVQNALPDATVWSVVFPYAQGGSPRHYLIWTHGNSPVRSRLFTPVLVDAETGLLTAALSLPWYLKALELSRPLHFGDYGGVPMKVLWVLLDVITIVVLGSGLYLWFKKRNFSIEDELVDNEESESTEPERAKASRTT